MTEFVTVAADDIARAWLDTILDVYAAPMRKAFHTVTRIGSVSGDGEPRIRRAASDLLTEFELPPLSTVANTIFPAAMARRTPDIADLARRYEEVYPELRRLEPFKNRDGTYFYRLIAYPGPSGPVNQLAGVIANLRAELANDSPKRARFETTLEAPGVARAAVDGTSDVVDSAIAEATPVFAADRDNQLMGFPCLSFLSFQHDKTFLHAAAHYRSQYLMQRGLGNYLGIAQLMRYLAQQVGLLPGRLTVLAGLAYADHVKKSDFLELEALRTALDETAATT
ncbi:hypothetical protein [Mycobacteroides abscessus]|uniref:Thymidylate synthase family protein n=1 Tax=Mycobacteroides abscessus 21 TaxID=1299324 RepID=A0A829Q969_9MYCO|nr:hypothetical protein [Mycobacteroides abscessus]EUA48787.1 thymidylate synthase family protein [Mycobacteroides abscessus 21]MBE5494375.1 hypothetical protein [Mycobacteroides abscessus]SHP47959.1 thymidylate synthase [Mycobacteroides abscessus subsp. abscessus]SHP49376.1 thymidylate synthase [Mycobacteroides abscessus subsp. abscessus]SHP66856.1 thymidylate synthase [Mycobacteroides abscessus subsp. abscessus]